MHAQPNVPSRRQAPARTGRRAFLVATIAVLMIGTIVISGPAPGGAGPGGGPAPAAGPPPPPPARDVERGAPTHGGQRP
jgi:hypothetical protein